MTTPETPLVDAKWLRGQLDSPGIRVLDATWIPPFLMRDATGEDLYRRAHIPGARYFDIDAVADPDAGDLPHMAPPPALFATMMSALGVRSTEIIVCYDQNRLLAAARAWWLFRLMGHERVFVLDGGLAAWRDADGPIESAMPEADESTGSQGRMAEGFVARRRPELLVELSALRSHVKEQTACVIDARSTGRFSGSAPEPRPGLPSGHLPGSINVPHSELIGEDGLLRAPDALRARFDAAGIDWDAPLIASCGSGVTAAVIALALARVGRWKVAVYDGSWSEWAATPGCPIEPDPSPRESGENS